MYVYSFLLPGGSVQQLGQRGQRRRAPLPRFPNYPNLSPQKQIEIFHLKMCNEWSLRFLAVFQYQYSAGQGAVFQ